VKADFWHERWGSGRTGFHQSQTNRYLVQYWDRLGVRPESRVFVPLCGKSGDMLWLRDQGHEVIGAELSPIAVHDFFDQNGLTASRSKAGDFERWDSTGISIFCGDVFALTPGHLDGVGAVYDRAALVALPPEMRRSYADHLRAVLPSGAKSLLVTIDYPQHQQGGPPFSVPDEEVHALFDNGFVVEQLASDDVKGSGERIGDPVDYLNQNAYVLTKAGN
jgi:thiopurine S-methyltransferase